MGKRSESRPSTPPPNQVRGRKRLTGSAAVLADLQARFAQFRSEHRPGARVPAALRAAALAALDKGVTSGELYRVCGISWSQLKAWKARHASPLTKVEEDEAPADVRVFSVVDADSVERPALEALELRLGPWSVRVGLAGLAQED